MGHISSTFLGTGSTGPRGSIPDGEGTVRVTVWQKKKNALLSTEYRPKQGLQSRGQYIWHQYPEAGQLRLGGLGRHRFC